MPDDMRPPDDDLEMIEMAGELTRARQGIPQPERTGEAFTRLMGEVEARRMGTSTNGAGILGWLGGSRWRGLLAAATAAVVLGGAGLGVAAATGNEPARKLFGISSDSAIKVEFKGVVVDATATELRVDANGDLRIVVVDDSTSFGDDGGVESIADIAPGTIVEVHGRLLPDNTILATRVDIEDGDDGAGTPGVTLPTVTTTASVATPPPAATTTPPATVPAAQPTFDDDDDRHDDDDNGGPGDDDGGDDDNSGPGGGDDDDAADDNSGPGAGDVDDGDDDNSGHSSGDDDGGHDDGGDDEGGDDDDDSGSGGGDDDGDDN